MITTYSSIRRQVTQLLVGASLTALSTLSFAQIEGKFTAKDGKTLLIIGQDLGSIEGYTSSGLFPEPGGVTNYTNAFDWAGLNDSTDYGSGEMNLQKAIDTYPNSVLSIGLYMVEKKQDDDEGPANPNGMLNLVNGQYDTALQRFADFALRNDPHPIMLRIGYEFDGDWNHYDPQRYQNAYRYIVDFLRARNVENVAYVFQSATWVNTGTNFEQWYPGDDYVDWLGLSFFFYATGQGDAGNADEIQAMTEFARRKNKPLQISESSAQYHDFDEGKFHPFDNPGSPSDMTGQEAWNQYFRDQLLRFVHENNDVVRQLAYINADWQSQRQWEWPRAGNGFWGDTRIERDPVIAQNWIDEISNTDFWIHGGPSLFSQLGIDGAVNPTPIPSATPTPPTVTPTPTPATPTPTSTPDAVEPSGWNFLIHKPSKTKIRTCATEDAVPASLAPESAIWECVQWKKVDTDGGHFHLMGRQAFKYLTPLGDSNGSWIGGQPNSWKGNWSQWSYLDTGDGFGHLAHRFTGKYIFGNGTENSWIQLQPSTWAGDYTRWKFEPIEGDTITPPTPSMTPTSRPTTPPSSETPDPTPGSSRVEAEDASFSGSARAFTDPSASGGEGVAFLDTVGAGFTMTNVPAASSVTVFYASQNTGSISMKVNGDDAGNINFTGNGAWSGNYTSVTTSVNIPAGASFTIVNESGDSAMNVDYVVFGSDGAISTPTPTITPAPCSNCGTPTPRPNPGTPPPVGDGITGKFVPKDGRTMMIIGQDLKSVSDYVATSAPAPAAVTTYVSFYGILSDDGLNGALGIDTADQPHGNDLDWGGGPLNAHSSAVGFTNSALQIGMSMAEGSNGNFWCQGCLAEVANGQRDGEIGQLADFFLSIPDKAVYLRIGYEFDGVWNNGYENRDNYIRAYRRVVDILRQRGVSNVAYVWQSATSPVDDVIERFMINVRPGNEDPFEWYPGDDYVDWIGMSWFLPPTEQPTIFDAIQNQITKSNQMANFAREKKKPLMIAETAVQGYDIGRLQNCNIGESWDGNPGGGCVSKTPDQIWNEWFVPMFDFVRSNSDVIKAVSYINADWNSQTLWDAPYASGYWGDTRVEANPTIFSNWTTELSDESFWMHGSSSINSDLK